MRNGDVQERGRHSLTVRPSPLVTPRWLFENLDDPQLVIADVRWYLSGPRGVDAYQEGHLPGALFADVDRDLADPPGPALRGRHPLPSADRFAEFLARAGIRRGDTVVAYDDGGGATAARLWWLLDYFGLGNGKVLDGGVQAWMAAGHPLETVTPRAPPGAAADTRTTRREGRRQASSGPHERARNRPSARCSRGAAVRRESRARRRSPGAHSGCQECPLYREPGGARGELPRNETSWREGTKSSGRLANGR